MTKERKCLSCNKLFKSISPANRICNDCKKVNDKNKTEVYKARYSSSKPLLDD